VAEAGAISSSDSRPPAHRVSPSVSSRKHHDIATNQNNPVDLFAFLQEHNDDLTIKVKVALQSGHALHFSDTSSQNFIPKLKDHILFRLWKLDITYCNHTFTAEEHNSIIIPNNTIYSVQTMRVYYTTYDLRREYDTINPRTHSDVMVLLGETTPSHPYWYARILGIYHTETWLNDGGQPAKQVLDILWVRWLAPLRSHPSGMNHTRLPKLAFVEESDPDTFGFLDPLQVVWGAHLISAFALGRGISSLCFGESLAHTGGELDDWEAHYVGMWVLNISSYGVLDLNLWTSFVDQDMFLHYTHLGVRYLVMPQRIIRDSQSAILANAMDIVNEADRDHEEDKMKAMMSVMMKGWKMKMRVTKSWKMKMRETRIMRTRLMTPFLSKLITSNEINLKAWAFHQFLQVLLLHAIWCSFDLLTGHSSEPQLPCLPAPFSFGKPTVSPHWSPAAAWASEPWWWWSKWILFWGTCTNALQQWQPESALSWSFDRLTPSTSSTISSPAPGSNRTF